MNLIGDLSDARETVQDTVSAREVGNWDIFRNECGH